MKKILFGLMVLSSMASVLPAQANTISIGNSSAWNPAVGDDAIYTVYEEQPNDDGVFTGTLEKKVTAIANGNVTIQVTLTKQNYDDSPAVTTTQTVTEMLMNIQNAGNEVQDCALDVGGDMLPISLVMPMGTISSCLMPAGLGKDLDGDPAVISNFIANIPFGVVRFDSTKISNGNHIRVTLKQTTLAQNQAK